MQRIMKQILQSVLLFSVCSLILSCGGTKTDPVDPASAETPAETRTLTFVLPDGLSWEDGDQIVVHGEYAKDQVTVTLASGDISSDGKSATKTVEGLRPYKRDDCTSTLYASFPAQAVDNLKHCFFYSKFSTTNEEILAACNEGDTFTFERICGVLSLSVEGDYEGYMISTPKKEAIGYEFLQVKITDSEKNYLQYLGNPVLQLEGNLDGGDILVYIPDGLSFESGFTLKLKEGGDYTKVFKYTEPVDIVRGEEVRIGDITAQLEDYENPFSADIRDLDTQGSANCYIVEEAGGYKFKAVKGNDPLAYLADPADATVLWESWNDLSEVTAGSVIASVAYAEDYIIIHTPETLRPGNAVVAATDADGKILWSWHIWVPATHVTSASYGAIMGKDILDRNLGALTATASGADIDPLSYGLMYQWGRKDPFTGAGALNTNKVATCAGAQDEVAPGQITLEQSVANPRLLGHANSGDWLIAADDHLWDDLEKTLYDPCPPGYRVPAMDTSVPFWAGISSQEGWGFVKEQGWFTIGSPAAVFPIAGYRDDYTVGSIAKVGDRTLIWTAHGSGASGTGDDLRFDGKTFTLKGAGKSRLGSVRCVAE